MTILSIAFLRGWLLFFVLLREFISDLKLISSTNFLSFTFSRRASSFLSFAEMEGERVVKTEIETGNAEKVEEGDEWKEEEGKDNSEEKEAEEEDREKEGEKEVEKEKFGRDSLFDSFEKIDFDDDPGFFHDTIIFRFFLILSFPLFRAL